MNELAQQSHVSLWINEDSLIIKKEVHAVAEILGLDPMEITNEGKALICVESSSAEDLLAEIQQTPIGIDARIIGEVRAEKPGMVFMKTRLGGHRIIEMPMGKPIPRVCRSSEPLPQARLIITGIVQGVGFRPFLFNLARNAQITGRIFNSGNLGVICDFRAPEADFQFKIFVESIRNTAPIMAFIEKIQIDSIPPDQSIDFSQLIIGASEDEVGTSVVLPPDIAIVMLV